MASHQLANGDGHKDLTVLVTGFSPFQERYPVNPSFEITRSLPETLPETPSDGRRIHIIRYGQPIRVAYRDVRDLVPKLLKSYRGTIDLVLHIGMASGRNYYTAEQLGHRDGYSRNKDLDGEVLPVEDGVVRFGDCPPEMTTSLDYNELLQRWKGYISDLPETSPAADALCQSSNDAGHYLCDYIYFNSLAWFARQRDSFTGGASVDRPVMFLHVPAVSEGQMIEKGREVAIAIIQAMADVLHLPVTNGL